MDSPNKKRHKQQQFEEKLNQIVKLIKLKQQNSLQLISYLQQIVNNRSELQKLFFLNDQISKHNFFLEKLNKKNAQYSQLENYILSSYLMPFQLSDFQRGLIKRVSARILEVFQSFNQKVQKFGHFQKEINIHYKIIKSKIIKLINTVDKPQSTMNSIAQFISSCFQYLNNKFTDQQKKLYRIIQFIQNGDIDKIQEAYTCQHCKKIQSQVQVKQQSKISHQKPQIKDKASGLSIDNYQSKYFSRQKQKIKQKLKGLRLEAKNKQNIKKKKTKFANKYYSLYQSAMEVHKGSFIDELVFFDEKQHSQKLLVDMLARNKYNESFINNYLNNNSQKFKQKSLKVFLPQQNASTLSQENSTQKILFQRAESRNSVEYYVEHDSQELVQKSKKQFKQIILIPDNKYVQNQQKNETKSFRITNPNKKTIVPTPKSNPNLFAIKQSQTFNFVKINMKNPISNQRSRLPDISNRLISLQDRRKSVKLMSKEPYSSSNNLLIVKTNISRKSETKKVEQKIRDSRNKEQKLKITDESWVTSKTKNLKRSQSGNKLEIQRNQKNSLKNLQINYSTSISKKLNKFCQIVSKKECAY